MKRSPPVCILLCALAIGAIDAATNYCATSLCPAGKKHIACNNSGAYASICLSTAKLVAIPAALQNTIVKKHNTLRNTLAKGGVSGFSPAARMATMKWDPELAQIATYNVKQCAMEHDQCRSTTKFPKAGQNLAYTSWSGSTKTVAAIAESHVQLWFNEYKDATMAQMNSYVSNGKMVGHFTQLSLEKATHVGCAILRQSSGSKTWQYFACNYAFITIQNRPVYTSGKAASKCTTGANPAFPALCSTSEVYDLMNA